MSKRQIGGYEFNAECASIRSSVEIIRRSLVRIIEENPGPQTTALLIARSTLELPNITNAINTIENIGKSQKGSRTTD